MQPIRLNKFRPLRVARFLAVSRLCLFVNFPNLLTVRTQLINKTVLKNRTRTVVL
jgi:hypothetical protein